MQFGRVNRYLIAVIILPCIAFAAIVDLANLDKLATKISAGLGKQAPEIMAKLDNLANEDTVLRFVSSANRGEHNRAQTVVSQGPSAPPAFCNKLDCPPFTVIQNTSSYQLREYSPSRWVSTTSVDIDYYVAQDQDFKRLFHYISGENKQKQKIDMTAPVINRIIPGQGPACANNFTMSFYISPKVTQPPAPSDKEVFLSQLPKLRVYVSSFGGFATKEEYLSEAVKLTRKLQQSGLSFVQDHFYTAGYDSPFKLLNRHNEVWIIAQ